MAGGQGIYQVPSASLVMNRQEVGIYSRDGRWFQYREVTVLEQVAGVAKVRLHKSEDLEEVASKNVPFLRIIHLETTGKGGRGHVH